MFEEYFLRRYSPLGGSSFEEIELLCPEEAKEFLKKNLNPFHPFNPTFDMPRHSMHKVEVPCACASLAFCTCP